LINQYNKFILKSKRHIKMNKFKKFSTAPGLFKNENSSKVFILILSLFLFFILSGCKSIQPDEYLSPGCPSAIIGGDCEKYGFEIHVCSNHRHAIKEDLKKNKALGYTLKGDADHEHLLIINGGHYFKLIKGKGIQVISEPTQGHTHTVTINCKKYFAPEERHQ